MHHQGPVTQNTTLHAEGVSTGHSHRRPERTLGTRPAIIYHSNIPRVPTVRMKANAQNGAQCGTELLRPLFEAEP